MIVNEEIMKKFLLNVYEDGQDRQLERDNIIKYYSFYEGKPEREEMEENPLYQGQSWKTPEGLDFKPSKDIRNHTRKLIQKQGRFMFGNIPDLSFKAFRKEQKDAAEGKRTFIDDILEDMGFWDETFKAFIDCTIGKRVLMIVIANPGEPASVRYYRSDCFSYKTDPMDYKKMMSAIIAFQDESTVGLPLDKQVWNKNKYYMENGMCKLETSQWDGNGDIINDLDIFDTGFDKLPCRVILNGGLIGDGDGTSDVEDLMDLAMAYNRTYSDYRDALRFRMFEQPVFLNASDESLDGLKIAPNSMINLKTDPSTPEATPDAKMLSSSFSFEVAAKTYLEATKCDMYELMDQPRPEDIRSVTSAKAIRFVFYDLMARCQEKWKAWMPAVRWAVDFLLEATIQLHLYKDKVGVESILTEGRLIINPCYPIPDDEEVTKKTAMAEVETKVRSRKSYIRDFSDIEEEDGEFDEIIDEEKLLKEAAADSFAMNDPNAPINAGGSKLVEPEGGNGGK